MLLSKLIGERYKETPSEAGIPSHMFLLKGGYIRQITNGIYTLLPPAYKIVRKLQQIMREEMDKIDGQEVLFPIVMPTALWDESGRNKADNLEILRFKDRKGTTMLFGLSHEEAAVHLSRTEARSYQQFPYMLYQFQTKFRDELRSRGGLIRVREFTMKDGYSYHTTQDDLDNYYEKAHKAYERIYKRAGIPEVVAVLSDNGIMGGDISHEFMLLTNSGEDTIAMCNKCDYKSNVDLAVSKQNYDDVNDITLQEHKKEHTKNIIDIETLVKYFNIKEEKLIKSTVFATAVHDNPVIVFTRGDREINESKLGNIIGANVTQWQGEKTEGLTLGYLGPVGLNVKDATILFDVSLKGGKNLIAGGNEIDFHLSGVSMERDFPDITFVDISKVKEGESCVHCDGGILGLVRGIEVGNIFQLGDTYSKSMDYTYVDEDGKEKHPVMGCYGIGVGRLLASIIEAKHDDYGPIWPYNVAPWQIHICVLNQKKEGVKETANIFYEKLSKKYEVIMDDRDAQPGMQFADADLLGVPIRIVVSPRNLKTGEVEIVTRDKTYKEMVLIDNVENAIEKLVKNITVL